METLSNDIIGLAEREQAQLSDQEIMEDWQIPLMEAMAKAITKQGGDILEIGFGRGVSAEMIQKYPIDSHTLIECNANIIDEYFHHVGHTILLVEYHLNPNCFPTNFFFLKKKRDRKLFLVTLSTMKTSEIKFILHSHSLLIWIEYLTADQTIRDLTE